MSGAPTRAGTGALLLCAGGILALTNGVRQSLGLFIAPLHAALGLGVAQLSFALGLGQFLWGIAQAGFGIWSDRQGAQDGPRRAVLAGIVLLALGLAGASLARGAVGINLTLGLLVACGTGAASFTLLFSGAAPRLLPEQRAFASGWINAGGSLGQFALVPLVQALILALGWEGALQVLALLMLGGLFLLRPLRQPLLQVPGAAAPAVSTLTAVRTALRDPAYLCLHAGFFACGFHVAFLATHLPTEVRLCGQPATLAAGMLALIGLANVGGSLGVGLLAARFRFKTLLVGINLLRALAIAAYLAAPHTPGVLLAFAVVLGLTWLSTVPPTAGLIAKRQGTARLATLFGLTLVTHQVGAFLGAWLGGIAFESGGDYHWMWRADLLLALLAAAVNLPIREAAPLRAAQPAAA